MEIRACPSTTWLKQVTIICFRNSHQRVFYVDITFSAFRFKHAIETHTLSADTAAILMRALLDLRGGVHCYTSVLKNTSSSANIMSFKLFTKWFTLKYFKVDAISIKCVVLFFVETFSIYFVVSCCTKGIIIVRVIDK